MKPNKPTGTTGTSRDKWGFVPLQKPGFSRDNRDTTPLGVSRVPTGLVTGVLKTKRDKPLCPVICSTQALQVLRNMPVSDCIESLVIDGPVTVIEKNGGTDIASLDDATAVTLFLHWLDDHRMTCAEHDRQFGIKQKRAGFKVVLNG